MVTARAEWAGRGKTAFRGGACGGSGIRGLRGAQVPEMLRAGWLRLCAALCSLLLGRAEAPSPGVPPEQSRPYAVLRGQNLGERRGAARGARLQPDPGAGSLCGARAARGWGSGPALVLAKLLFLLSTPGLGASARTLCVGGTCWNWKLETWVCALLSLALWIKARQPGSS